MATRDEILALVGKRARIEYPLTRAHSDGLTYEVTVSSVEDPTRDRRGIVGIIIGNCTRYTIWTSTQVTPLD